MPDPPLILGSASPRRADLLRMLGVDFVVETVSIDEASLVQSNDIASTVRHISEAKYAALEDELLGQKHPLAVMLTADTLVACGDVILGKPATNDHLIEMLSMMSGQSLTIATAVSVGVDGESRSTDVVVTRVQLRELTAVEIERYVASGAGSDKAGGLALQSEAAHFIADVDGCWSNVLGLPLCSVVLLLGSGDVRRCSIQTCGGLSR